MIDSMDEIDDCLYCMLDANKKWKKKKFEFVIDFGNYPISYLRGWFILI